MSTENITLKMIKIRTDRINAETNEDLFLNLHPAFQRKYECWDDKLKTGLIETLILLRAMNPIWTVFNEDENSEEVLDGKHRIMTALDFIDNKFCLNRKYLMTLNGDEYSDKYFRDLSFDQRNKLKNYNFTFNKLGSDIRKDENQLREQYHRLNRTTMVLNDYEFEKVLLNDFYNIISRHKNELVQTELFQKRKDARGNIDVEIIEMLALANNLPTSWESLNSLKEKWIKNELGETSESVKENLKEKKNIFDEKLILIRKIIKELSGKNVFSDNSKIFKSHLLLYKIFVSRCTYLIGSYPLFNRVFDKLVEKSLDQLFTDNIQLKLDCKSRNATFQKKFCILVDEIINSEIHQIGSKRFFTKEEISKKLKDQNFTCPKCKLQIKNNDQYEGDHIIPWTSNGSTTFENLQVLHKRCHQLK